MYSDLITALENTGIPFAEYAWAARPEGTYGVYQLDMVAGVLIGDDSHVDTALEGSVDLFLTGPDQETIEAVEAALESVCGSAWHLNSIQYENATRLIHREYVFQITADAETPETTTDGD